MTMSNSFNNCFAKGAIDTHPILHQILQFKRKYFDYIPLANNESLFVTPIDTSEVFNITSFKVESDGPNSSFSIKILKLLFFFFFFFSIGIHSMQGRTVTTRHGVTRKKKAQKRLQATENLFRKNLQLKDVC